MPTASNAGLRLELTVRDMEASKDFYTRLLDFEIEKVENAEYIALRNGHARIGLSTHSVLHDERVGRGVEIVLEVDDVGLLHERVLSAGPKSISVLKKGPWGPTDFTGYRSGRLFHPRDVATVRRCPAVPPRFSSTGGRRPPECVSIKPA